MTPAEIATLDEARFGELATGTPMRRIGFHGLRRSACLSLGATRDHEARDLLRALSHDANSLVSQAAAWSLGRLDES